MNNDQQKEYEEHFSPDGEYIQYQMEHPEMNDQPNMSNTIKPSQDKTVENFHDDVAISRFDFAAFMGILDGLIKLDGAKSEQEHNRYLYQLTGDNIKVYKKMLKEFRKRVYEKVR